MPRARAAIDGFDVRLRHRCQRGVSLITGIMKQGESFTVSDGHDGALFLAAVRDALQRPQDL